MDVPLGAAERERRFLHAHSGRNPALSSDDRRSRQPCGMISMPPCAGRGESRSSAAKPESARPHSSVILLGRRPIVAYGCSRETATTSPMPLPTVPGWSCSPASVATRRCPRRQRHSRAARCSESPISQHFSRAFGATFGPGPNQPGGAELRRPPLVGPLESRPVAGREQAGRGHGGLIVITYRSDDLARMHPLYRQLPALIRESDSHRIELRPLDRESLRELVESWADLPAPDADRLVAYLERHAEGNPFFATELLRALEEKGLLVEREGRVGAGGA